MRRGRFRRGPPRQKTVWLAVIAFLLIAQWLSGWLPWPAHRFNFESSGPYRVLRVVDGDTLLLEGHVRVRLIGVDTPETKHPHRPVEPLGLKATEFTREMVEGREVTLQFDRERKDRFGRVLAYVSVGDALLNEELILAGYSRAETRFHFDRSMAARFRRAEQQAREAGRGMWQTPAAIPEH